jgi:hypothetical protein
MMRGERKMTSIHDLACKKVVDYERSNGRQANDVSHLGKGYDIEGDRNIEVKATKSPDIPGYIHFYGTSWKWFRNDPKAWVYIVYDIEKEPKLVMLDRDALLKLENSKYVGVYVLLPTKLRKDLDRRILSGHTLT